MWTYILVLVVVVAVLYVSFRSLAGGEPLGAEDGLLVLRRLADATAERGRELDEALAGPRDPAAAAGDGRRQPQAEAAGAARRKLAAYLEQLGRLEVTPGGDDGDEVEAARALLTAAVEDLAWAARMVEAGGHVGNPGIREAVAGLRRHAQACLEDVRAATAPPNGAGDAPRGPAT